MTKKSKSSPPKKKSAPKKRSIVKKAAATKKKAVAQKAASKKKVTKKSSPVKKESISKKKATAKKASSPLHKSKAITPRQKSRTKQKIERQTVLAPAIDMESNLPPVEEKSPVQNETAIPARGMDKKSVQRAAARNYDNHHIQLSNRKGGIKPSGKKPLW